VRFCEICGALVAAEPAAVGAGPAADLVTDYSSGSFRDLMEDLENSAPPTADPPVTGWPAPEPVRAEPVRAEPVRAEPVRAEPVRAEPVRAEPVAAEPAVPNWLAATPLTVDPPTGHARKNGAHDDPPTLTDVDAGDIDAQPDPGLAGADPAGGAHRRKRGPRMLAVALGVVVAVAAILTSGFMLLHHGGRQAQASASPAHGTRPATSASASSAAHAILPAKWTAPTPLDQQAAKIGNPTITGVSCPQRAMCFAVDSVGAIMSYTAGGSWQTAATDAKAGLVSISCASSTFCVALDSSGSAVTLDQGAWSSPALVDSRVGTFTAVSCPVPAFCMTVDSAGSAFAYTGSAAGWQPFTVDSTGMGLASVSCTSAAYCVAAGDTGDVFTYNGTSWSAGQAVDSSNAFAAVSCSSPAFCAAVDRSGNAATFTGGQWTVAKIGAVADAISCPSDGYCVAVDSAGGALVYRDARWSAVTSIDGGNAVQALSCPAVAACAATDSMGNVMYYSATPAGG